MACDRKPSQCAYSGTITLNAIHSCKLWKTGRIYERKDNDGMTHSVRTLVLTQFAPYPPLGGVELRNWQNINALMKLGPVAVLSISNSAEVSQDLWQYPPGVELWHHHYLKKTETQLPFWEKILWRVQPHRHFATDWYYEKSSRNQLKQVLEEFQPTLVVLEEILLYRYLSMIKQYGCPIIFDEHNSEASLFLERQPYASGLKKLDLMLQLRKILAIERDFIHQVDQVWTCSDEDTDLLQQSYQPKTNIYTIPNGIDVHQYDGVRLGTTSPPDGLSQTPRTLIYPANFRYPPNQVAAKLLIDEIFPRLQKVYPDSSLILAGKSPTSGMVTAAQHNPKITVTGFVEDMLPYLAAASLVVVPLQHGGGTRLKILEAFAAGRPVVSTAKGAEGVKALDRRHLLIRNKINEIVNGVSEIWEDPALGHDLAKNAYELAIAEYSRDAITCRIERNVSELLGLSTSTNNPRSKNTEIIAL